MQPHHDHVAEYLSKLPYRVNIADLLWSPFRVPGHVESCTTASKMLKCVISVASVALWHQVT